MTPLLYNVIALSLVVLALLLFRRMGRTRAPGFFALLLVGGGLAGAVAVLALLGYGFGIVRLLAYGVFVHFPLFLFGTAVLLRGRRRGLARFAAITGIAIILVGVEAFLIEPHWLQVTRRTITSPKLERPVRVAVLADIQTDAPGPYEERVLREVRAANPDLILFAGDYLQVPKNRDKAAAVRTFQNILRQADLRPPLGSYAVRGNFEHRVELTELFARTPVIPLQETQALDLGPLALTGLSVSDSFNRFCAVAAQPKFHLVLGHSPDFSLGQVEADLLVAGHTHGGQVRLPFIGPLATGSAVPRKWGSGLTEIAPRKHLLVSRGVGMERGSAPRLRFLCRPELAIVDLLPE